MCGTGGYISPALLYTTSQVCYIFLDNNQEVNSQLMKTKERLLAKEKYITYSQYLRPFVPSPCRTQRKDINNSFI